MKKTNEYILWDESDKQVVTSMTAHRLVRGPRFDGEVFVQIPQGPHGGCVAQEAPPVPQDTSATGARSQTRKTCARFRHLQT